MIISTWPRQENCDADTCPYLTPTIRKLLNKKSKAHPYKQVINQVGTLPKIIECDLNSCPALTSLKKRDFVQKKHLLDNTRAEASANMDRYQKDCCDFPKTGKRPECCEHMDEKEEKLLSTQMLNSASASDDYDYNNRRQGFSVDENDIIAEVRRRTLLGEFKVPESQVSVASDKPDDTRCCGKHNHDPSRRRSSLKENDKNSTGSAGRRPNSGRGAPGKSDNPTRLREDSVGSINEGRKGNSRSRNDFKPPTKMHGCPMTNNKAPAPLPRSPSVHSSSLKSDLSVPDARCCTHKHPGKQMDCCDQHECNLGPKSDPLGVMNKVEQITHCCNRKGCVMARTICDMYEPMVKKCLRTFDDDNEFGDPKYHYLMRDSTTSFSSILEGTEVFTYHPKREELEEEEEYESSSTGSDSVKMRAEHSVAIISEPEVGPDSEPRSESEPSEPSEPEPEAHAHSEAEEAEPEHQASQILFPDDHAEDTDDQDDTELEEQGRKYALATKRYSVVSWVDEDEIDVKTSGSIEAVIRDAKERAQHFRMAGGGSRISRSPQMRKEMLSEIIKEEIEKNKSLAHPELPDDMATSSIATSKIVREPDRSSKPRRRFVCPLFRRKKKHKANLNDEPKTSEQSDVQPSASRVQHSRRTSIHTKPIQNEREENVKKMLSSM